MPWKSSEVLAAWRISNQPQAVISLHRYTNHVVQQLQRSLIGTVQSIMDTVFQIFHQAQSQYAGPLLATTLSPIPPPHDPTLLRRFHKGSNVFSIQGDIQKYIKARPSYLPNPEANAWIDIYVAYWKALGEILRAETGHHRDDWAIKVYEAWKEILTLLIRGYSPASGFGAWTMPCLYTVGKYLRVFAIKADEEQSKMFGQEGGPEDDGLGDDVMGSVEKNKWLEDAARVINEVFRLCISDRYVALIHPITILICPGHQSKSLANGEYTIPQISSSRHTSRYTIWSFQDSLLITGSSSTRLGCQRTFFAPFKLRKQIFRPSKTSLNHTL